jgi:S1-C subfamily serine protease
MAPLLLVSEAIAVATARAAPLLTAIRVGPNRHITGFLWNGSIIVTSDQILPAQDSYSVVLASGALTPARPGPRDPSANLAMLRLDSAAPGPILPRGNGTTIGSLVLALNANFDGSPGVRLAAVHRVGRSAGGSMASMVLDMPAMRLDPGGPVLNAAGDLLGIAQVGVQGEALVLPWAAIAQLCGEVTERPPPPPPQPPPIPPPTRPPARVPLGPRRGWLGVALQPITVPDTLAQRAGQASARMVMSITAGGPADRAGLRVGDVLLALNGHNTSGSHALRAFLAADKIGTQIEVRLLRDGTLLTTQLTVAAQPAE